MASEAVARLVAAGRDVTLDLIGPTIGLIGDQEADAIREEARRAGATEFLDKGAEMKVLEAHVRSLIHAWSTSE